MMTESTGTNERGADTALSIAQIRRGRLTGRIGLHTYLFDEIDSTNDVACRLANRRLIDGTAVLAEAQMVGRGRLGMPWLSPPRVNLYASVILRPRITIVAAAVYAMIASLALTDVLRAEGLRAEIKWPNDVVVERRKVAGTLGACRTRGAIVDYLVLGVGVNLNVDRMTLRTCLAGAAASATSVSECLGRLVDRNAFAAAYFDALERWDDAYRAHGPAHVLAERRRRDALVGQALRIGELREEYAARGLGVADDGRLLVEDAHGRRREIVDAQVRFEGAA